MRKELLLSLGAAFGRLSYDQRNDVEPSLIIFRGTDHSYTCISGREALRNLHDGIGDFFGWSSGEAERLELLVELQEIAEIVDFDADGDDSLPDVIRRLVERAEAGATAATVATLPPKEKPSAANRRVAEAREVYARDGATAGPVEGLDGVELVDHETHAEDRPMFYVHLYGKRMGEITFLGLQPGHSGIGWFAHADGALGVPGGVCDVGSRAAAIDHVLTWLSKHGASKPEAADNAPEAEKPKRTRKKKGAEPAADQAAPAAIQSDDWEPVDGPFRIKQVAPDRWTVEDTRDGSTWNNYHTENYAQFVAACDNAKFNGKPGPTYSRWQAWSSPGDPSGIREAILGYLKANGQTTWGKLTTHDAPAGLTYGQIENALEQLAAEKAIVIESAEHQWDSVIYLQLEMGLAHLEPGEDQAGVTTLPTPYARAQARIAMGEYIAGDGALLFGDRTVAAQAVWDLASGALQIPADDVKGILKALVGREALPTSTVNAELAAQAIARLLRGEARPEAAPRPNPSAPPAIQKATVAIAAFEQLPAPVLEPGAEVTVLRDNGEVEDATLDRNFPGTSRWDVRLVRGAREVVNADRIRGRYTITASSGYTVEEIPLLAAKSETSIADQDDLSDVGLPPWERQEADPDLDAAPTW